jgi:hypothetical protein
MKDTNLRILKFAFRRDALIDQTLEHQPIIRPFPKRNGTIASVHLLWFVRSLWLLARHHLIEQLSDQT